MAKQVNSTTPIAEAVHLVFQACLHFKMSERNRAVAEMKYKDQTHTMGKWEKLFKSENLI